MDRRVDQQDSPLFFQTKEVVECADSVVDPTNTNDRLFSELKRIFSGLEDVKIRIAALESLDTSGISRSSLTYIDDVKFYSWLKNSYRDRISRKNFFSSEYIIGEPCWDILLDLCISEIEGRKISVTSACLASGVPITTALRWISLLERDQLIQKESDNKDRRRTFLRISKSGFESMFRYFKSVTLRT